MKSFSDWKQEEQIEEAAVAPEQEATEHSVPDRSHDPEVQQGKAIFNQIVSSLERFGIVK